MNKEKRSLVFSIGMAVPLIGYMLLLAWDNPGFSFWLLYAVLGVGCGVLTSWVLWIMERRSKKKDENQNQV